jgi:hypothetical protein
MAVLYCVLRPAPNRAFVQGCLSERQRAWRCLLHSTKRLCMDVQLKKLWPSIRKPRITNQLNAPWASENSAGPVEAHGPAPCPLLGFSGAALLYHWPGPQGRARGTGGPALTRSPQVAFRCPLVLGADPPVAIPIAMAGGAWGRLGAGGWERLRGGVVVLNSGHVQWIRGQRKAPLPLPAASSQQASSQQRQQPASSNTQHTQQQQRLLCALRATGP